MSSEFDKAFLEERVKFIQVKMRFDEVFDSNGCSKSKYKETKSSFLKDFNNLAKFLLKSNRKIKVPQKADEGKNPYNSRSGNIFIGGKSGITNRDYGGEGLSENELVEFFLNLDKIDVNLRGELTKHYYDKWLSFISCFEFGVEKILFSNSKKILSGDLKRSFNKTIIVRKCLVGDDTAISDDDDDDVLVDGVSDYKEVVLNSVSVVAENDGVSCNLVIDGEEINLYKFNDEADLFSIRDYLDELISLEMEFRGAETKMVEQQKAQFEAFRKKCQPYLNLMEI